MHYFLFFGLLFGQVSLAFGQLSAGQVTYRRALSVWARIPDSIRVDSSLYPDYVHFTQKLSYYGPRQFWQNSVSDQPTEYLPEERVTALYLDAQQANSFVFYTPTSYAKKAYAKHYVPPQTRCQYNVLRHSRSILGYTCQGVQAEYLGRIYTLWVCPDLPIEMRPALQFPAPFLFDNLPLRGAILGVEQGPDHFEAIEVLPSKYIDTAIFEQALEQAKRLQETP